MVSMSGGQAVVSSLLAQDVTVAFGIIGGQLMPVYDALYDVQDRFTAVTGHHEAACCYMAQGYARASGRPGLFFAVTGPAIANTMGALGEAWHGNTPVLGVTSNVETNLMGRYVRTLHHPIDQAGMLHHLADNVVTATSTQQIVDGLETMFARFATARPKPQILEVPADILVGKGEAELPRKVEARPVRPAPADLERAARMLAEAKRPCIWAGGGVLTAGATSALVKLAETWGAPVVTTQGGKSAFPEDHPLFLGSSVGGRIYGANPIHDFLPTCDLLLVAGSSLAHWFTKGVGLKLPERLIHISLDTQMIDNVYPAALALVADLRLTLEALVEAIADRGVQVESAFRREVEAWRRKVEESIWAFKPNETRTMRAIREVLPRNAITTFDPAAPGYACVRRFPVYEPRSAMMAHGWDGIGFGFPAAIGARAARPDAPVFCLTGDGSFQFYMQELGAAVQHDLPVVAVIFNDGAWGQLKKFQLERFGPRYIGVDLKGPDFVTWADAYGVPATRATTLAELCRALDEAARLGTSYVIDVPIPNGFAEFR